MALHLLAYHERKECGTLVNIEEQHKGVFLVIKPLKTKKLMYILYINIQAVPQGKRCASTIKADR
jgi:hypothetical protein